MVPITNFRPPSPRRRRRFRTRLLGAMLVVGLLPLALLAAVVVADIGSVSRATATEAENTLVTAAESDQQRQVDDRSRLLQAAVDGVTAQLQALRQRAAAAMRTTADVPQPPSKPLPPLSDVAGVGVLHDRAPSGAYSTVLVAPRNPATPTALLQDVVGTTAQLEPEMEAARATAGVRSVWVADTAAGMVRVSPDLDVPAAVGSGGIDPTHLLSAGDGPPFSARTARAGDLAPGPTWESEAVTPTDLGVHPTFSAVYRTAGSGGLGVTLWSPVTAGAHRVVGIDLDVRQLIGATGDTAVSDRPGAGTLLVAGGDGVLAASPGLSAALHLPAGVLAPALPVGDLRAGIEGVLATGTARIVPATIGADRDEVFTTPVHTAHWVLASAVPRRALVPDRAALSRGVDQGVRHILADLIPLTVGAVLLAGLLATLAARHAVGPLRGLSRAAERLGAGDIDAPVLVEGRDEFSVLAQSLERMRVEVHGGRDAILAAAHELEQRVDTRTTELRERNEELVALNRLAGSLTRSLEADVILAGGLESLEALVPLRAARGYVVDEGRLRGLVVRGAVEDGDAALTAVAEEAAANHDVVRHAGEGGTCLVGLPLQTHDGTLGAIGLRAAAEIPAGGRSEALLRAVADQVALALRTAVLSAEGREMAVLEERTRLAREIHDTLAQQLTAIVLQLEAADALVARDRDRGRSLVVAARDQARAALAEARRSVWDLRPAPLEATGLAGAVALEAARFSQRTGIPVTVAADGVPRDPGVSPEAEVALFRILQEALTNAGRHSHATRVVVELAPRETELVLSVSDDGCGFEADGGREGGFGLVGMTERARLVGADISVTGQPGSGTVVTVRLPLRDSVAGEPGRTR